MHEEASLFAFTGMPAVANLFFLATIAGDHQAAVIHAVAQAKWLHAVPASLIRCGVRIRYEHNGHVFDGEDRRRNAGVPISEPRPLPSPLVRPDETFGAFTAARDGTPASNSNGINTLEPPTYRLVRLRIQGLWDSPPYDTAPWTVRYTEVEGHNLVGDVIANQTLRVGAVRVRSDAQTFVANSTILACRERHMFAYRAGV